MPDLVNFDEPTLLFGHDQSLEDPRDGLTLFGPLDQGKPYGIRAGVIGTKDGVKYFRKWVKQIQGPISNIPSRIARPPFPGFEAIFHIPWNSKPSLEIIVADEQIDRAIYIDDRHQRVFNTVEVYLNAMLQTISAEETPVDIWFVVIPNRVYQFCRPQSYVSPSLSIKSDSKLSVKKAKRLYSAPSLFPEENQKAVPYHFEVNFHNQLKARLLDKEVPTQIIRESTIAYKEVLNSNNEPLRNMEVMESAIAWNLATATFYKCGGRPWKLGTIRDGVCYIGLVFKKDDKLADPRSACCAAQMFLDSGDGVVFRGAVGPWYSTKRGDFHLSRQAARDLVSLAVESYKRHKGEPPKELFIHGRVGFWDQEWEGFQEAVGKETNLVGIRIRSENNFKLYRDADLPILRGLAYIKNDRSAFLWTNGYIPRLQTYPGREVPNPLRIDISKGNASIDTVMEDILALTKLNYNTCVFADSRPVTLKFANAVGEILTAGPIRQNSPLPFKYYI